MFDFVRTHQKLMQFLLLLLIIPSFVFFGVGIDNMVGHGQDLAKVAGQSVTTREFESEFREQLDRLRQRLGPQFDAKNFDTPEAKQDLLERMITDRAVAAEAANRHMTVSDQQLQQVIASNPNFVGADGKFDRKHFLAVLEANRLTEKGYESRLREDLTAQLVTSGIQSSAFAPKSVATRLSEIVSQEREVQELVFKPADYTSKVAVSDDMLKAYYDTHPAQFEVPEQASIEYVVLSLNDVMTQTNVSDDEVKAFYDANLKQYTTEEERRASHILVAVPKNAPDQQKAAAKAKAEALLVQLRQDPSRFADLAKKNSDDDVSAPQGGDLGYFVRSKKMLASPEVQEAAFKLQEGAISDLVQSDFGFHIVQLTGIKPASQRPFDAVKGEIAEQMKQQQAQKKFSEMAETFNNTVYEQADSLKPAADKLKLKIETASGLTRQPDPLAKADAVYNSPKFLKSLFTDEVIKNKHNTEAVDVNPTTLVSGRIVNYKPTTRRPFDEVKESVREKVIQEEAAKLAKKAGEEKLAALKAKDDAAGFPAAKVISREKSQEMDRTALTAVMKADVNKLPAYVGVDLDGKGYAIYRIVKVGQPEKVDEARRKMESEQIADILAQQEMAAYIEALKQKYKAKVVSPFTAASNGDADKSGGKQ